MARKDYLYQHYTWPELGSVAKKQPVVVLPIGSVEDHGPHLPLDVDNFLIWSICEAAAQRAAGDILLMPFIWPSLALKEIRDVRQSGRGGMAHACELETSVYL